MISCELMVVIALDITVWNGMPPACCLFVIYIAYYSINCVPFKAAETTTEVIVNARWDLTLAL